MKHGTSNLYQVSNNFPSTRSGSKRAVAAKKVEKLAKTISAGNDASEANDEAEKPQSGVGTPTQKTKRRDMKATPVSHASTKASEMANLNDAAGKTEDDPIAGATTGAGGSSTNPVPLDREELASSSKVLFGGDEGGKKKVVPRKPYEDFSTEEEALEAALIETEAERKKRDEAKALAEEQDVDEAQEEVASTESEAAGASILGGDGEIDGEGADDKGDDGKEDESEEALPIVFSPVKDQQIEDGVDAGEKQAWTDLEDAAGNAHPFLTIVEGILQDLFNARGTEGEDDDEMKGAEEAAAGQDGRKLGLGTAPSEVPGGR